jgi:hypothetical protein
MKPIRALLLLLAVIALGGVFYLARRPPASSRWARADTARFLLM